MGDDALPGLLGIQPGEDRHLGALADAGVHAHLVEGSLDPVGAGLLDDHIGLRAGILDLADGAVDGAEHIGVLEHFLGVFDLGLLDLLIVLGLGQVGLQLAQLDVERSLFVAGGSLELLVDIADLLFLLLDAGLEPLQVQILAVQGQAQLVGVVAEELAAGADLVAHGHMDGLDGFIQIPGDLNGVFADDNAGKFFTAEAGGGQHGHLHHGHLGALLGAAAQNRTQRQGQGQLSDCFSHKNCNLLPYRQSGNMFPIIRGIRRHVNCSSRKIRNFIS